MASYAHPQPVDRGASQTRTAYGRSRVSKAERKSRGLITASDDAPRSIAAASLFEFAPDATIAAVGARMNSTTIRTAVLCAMFCFSIGVWGQATAPVNENAGSQVKRPESAPIDIRIPDRLRRQIAPTPSAPWHAPDLSGYTSAPKSAELSPIDPQRHYELVELIDLAQRMNPETRVAWESAVRAAIGVGLVQAEYYPMLTLAATGGYLTEAIPAPTDVAPTGFFRADLATVLPVLSLRWLLLDFGRRSSAMDSAKQGLLAANLGFNRKHQEIIYNVQRSFLALTSIRAKIAVAENSVNAARAVRDSAETQLSNGLATIQEVSLARQQEAQTAFDLEDVLANERDAEVALAESIGIPPTTPIQITEFPSLPPPAALETSVDKVIDQALARRPDLIAKVAALRAKEAEVRSARAASYPVLALASNFNTISGGVQITGGGHGSTGWFSSTQPSGGVLLSFEWNVFDGGAAHRRLEMAEAERRTAEDEVTLARDKAIQDVWKAYSDVRLALRKLDVATALVDASQKSYDASLEANHRGLGTLTDLLAARRDLSHAQFVEVDTKLQLLNASSALAFATGDAQRRPQ
jgi:outer membrane protein